jgi:hypothetical protein
VFQVFEVSRDVLANEGEIPVLGNATGASNPSIVTIAESKGPGAPNQNVSPAVGGSPCVIGPGGMQSCAPDLPIDVDEPEPEPQPEASAAGAGARQGGGRQPGRIRRSPWLDDLTPAVASTAAAETANEGGAQAAETVRRFVRQDEFDAIQKALGSGAEEVQVGRYFTPDAITSPGVAAQQLALPGTETNPLVGYFDMPASSLPSERFATFGPRLVQADFFQPGFGLEIEVSELFGRPYVPTSGLRLVGF